MPRSAAWCTTKSSAVHVFSSYTPGARCSAFHTLGPSANAHVRSTVRPSSAAWSSTCSTSHRPRGSAARTMRKNELAPLK